MQLCDFVYHLAVGVDYSGERNATFVISSPTGRKCINITIINDELIEAPEVFVIELSSSLEQGTLRREIRVYIQDDDSRCIYTEWVSAIVTILFYSPLMQF